MEIRKTNTLWPGENGSFQEEIEASNSSAEKYFSCHDARTPLKCKGVQDCLGLRFHVVDFGFPALNSSLCWWDFDSGLQSLVRFQIPKATILDSTGKIIDPRFRIPRAKLLGFRIPRAKLLGVRNPDSLT